MGGRRILVVEDDQSTRELLVAALRGEGYDTAGASDAAATTELLHHFRPDLALVDVDLGDGADGIAVALSLRSVILDLPLVFLTAASDQDHRLRAFDVGADDYLGKPFSFLELLARVEAVLRRAGNPSRRMLTVGDLSLDLDALTVERDGAPIAVTSIEFSLLHALARNVGTPMPKGQLLREVWGFDEYDVNVVEVYVSALRRKLETAGERLIHTIRGVGYVLRPTPPRSTSRHIAE